MTDATTPLVNFELVSPTRLLFSEAVEMVVIPGAEGDIGVLPGHSPLIATVRSGIINIYYDGKVKDRIFVGGGFAEISRERCTVLAEEAIPVSDIDRNAAETRLAKAKKNAEAYTDSEAAREIAIAQSLVTAAKEVLG
jgi:F-type H+-transporting ATPase subunit epsilon